MAIPGILQQLARNNPMMQSLKQMIGMVNSSQNPMAALNQLMAGNPQMKQATDIASKYGGDYKTAFYETAKQMGVDPDEILSMFR